MLLNASFILAAQLVVVACLAVCRCLFLDVVISGPAIQSLLENAVLVLLYQQFYHVLPSAAGWLDINMLARVVFIIPANSVLLQTSVCVACASIQHRLACLTLATLLFPSTPIFCC